MNLEASFKRVLYASKDYMGIIIEYVDSEYHMFNESRMYILLFTS